VSAANLSTKLFLDCLCLPGAAGTGLVEGEIGLCEAKTGQAEPDWLFCCFLARKRQHHFLALASLTSGDALRRITSPDVLSGLASCRRQPCVPARSLPALRPLMHLSAMRLILKWFFIPAKRALRPRMLLRALRPGVIFASLASADAFRRLASNQLPSLPDEVGLASCLSQPSSLHRKPSALSSTTPYRP